MQSGLWLKFHGTDTDTDIDSDTDILADFRSDLSETRAFPVKDHRARVYTCKRVYTISKITR